MRLKVLLALSDVWPGIGSLIQRFLDPTIIAELIKLGSSNYSHKTLTAALPHDEAAFLLYRSALAFLEQPELARYRFQIDGVLASRLLPKRYGVETIQVRRPEERAALRQRLLSPTITNSEYQMWPDNGAAGTFIRTVDFLSYIGEFPRHLDFSEEEIKFIFERTHALSYLMSANELEAIYQSSTGAGRIIVSTLALALYKEQHHDEDVDFKFRYTLQSAIQNSHNGNLVGFIQSIAVDTPNIAKFLVSTLDRQTVQKLYLLVENANQADSISQELLRSLGERLDHLPYLIEADRIRAHMQISKLKTDIDDSRIYVDGISLRKWVRENPNSYIKEYRRLI